MDRDALLVAALSFFASIFIFYIPLEQNYKIALALAFSVLVGLYFNPAKMLFALFLLASFAFFQPAYPYIVTLELHLGLLLSAIYFMGKDLKRILIEKIKNPKALFRAGLEGIGLYIVIIVVLLAFGLTVIALGYKPDTMNVYDKITGLPIYLLVFAILFAPLSEEFFFRGLLSRKYGPLVSSLVFAASHFGYGSLYEMAGAFLIGMVLALYLSKRNNLAACMVAHGLFILTSIALMLAMKGIA
ncbi:MAG: type II CAAX endopeptidase family protein [Candidatus ainarchaeum sp.]|nr:type II CAAX endopeptidase family protein [Candidatus ainarchaeum sp.]